MTVSVPMAMPVLGEDGSPDWQSDPISVWKLGTANESDGKEKDKNLKDLLRIADRHFIIQRGQVVWQGDSDALQADEDLRQKYLGF